jgi:cytochrome b561
VNDEPHSRTAEPGAPPDGPSPAADGSHQPDREQEAPAAGPRPPRLRRGELISAAGALVLLPLMFALKWFGLEVTPGPSAERSAISSAENAWHGLADLRWLMLITIAAAVGAVLLHVSQRSHGSKTDTSGVVAILGTVTAALLAYRVLIDLPSPNQVVDQKIGAYLGLLAAVTIALGGWESMGEERLREKFRRTGSRAKHRLASGSRAR